MNRRTIRLVLASLALIAIVIVAAPRVVAFVAPESQLAQILAVDIGVLKEWGTAGALKGGFGEGTKGKQVALLQRMLLQDPTLSSPTDVTGYYGTVTEDAVRRFQEEQGLPETGFVDAATADALNGIFLEHLCPEPEDEDKEDRLLHRMTKRIPESYVPPDLVDVSKRVRSAGIVCLRKDVADELERMFKAAKDDGVTLSVTSGYRKPGMQSYLYTFWSGVVGDQAKKEVAQPGRSEHQLGSTVDLTDASIKYSGADKRFAASAGGLWLKEHAHEYGFILSYPEGQEEETGFVYEPWHWRFVGEDIAERVAEEGMLFNASKESDFKKGKKKK